jgi:LmbE family N-acetylglucosaminyl deacetylase
VNLDDIPDTQIDIVAIGAHPDDTELGVGGTLAKLSKKGITTGIIDLTNAEPTPGNDLYDSPLSFSPDYDAKRKAEAQCAAKKLGLTARITMDLPNRRLFDTFDNRCALATVFRKWKPKIALVMYGRTVMASPDHYAAQKITEGAIFYSRLSKWEIYMNKLPVHRLKNLLYFPVRGSGVLHPQSEAGQLTSFFIDISEVIEQKKEAILCYKSQFQDQGKGDFVEYILQRNRAYGNIAGRQIEYAEHLASLSPFVLDNFDLFL